MIDSADDPVDDPAPPVPTPRYRAVLDTSVEVSQSMRHSYVGVEHLFLAIIRDRDAVPNQVLAGLIDLDETETALLALMASPSYRTGTANIVPPSE